MFRNITVIQCSEPFGRTLTVPVLDPTNVQLKHGSAKQLFPVRRVDIYVELFLDLCAQPMAVYDFPAQPFYDSIDCAICYDKCAHSVLCITSFPPSRGLA